MTCVESPKQPHLLFPLPGIVIMTEIEIMIETMTGIVTMIGSGEEDVTGIGIETEIEKGTGNAID